MMKILRYTMIAASVLAFAACTNDEEIAGGGSYLSDPDAVAVNALIGSPLTRANTEGDGDQFIYDATSPEVIYVENTGSGKIAGKEKGYYCLQSDGVTWVACNADGSENPTQYVVWATGSATEKPNSFRGVYPAQVVEPFEVPTDQSDKTKLRLADYMVAESGEMAKPADRQLNLNFKHQLAKVTVALVFNNQYTGNETINSLKFYLVDGATAITACPDEVTENGMTKKTYTALLDPGTYTDVNNFFCSIDVEGNVLNVRVPSSGIELTQGVAHTLTLYVGKNAISMGKMNVTEWGNTVELEDNVADENP